MIKNIIFAITLLLTQIPTQNSQAAITVINANGASNFDSEDNEVFGGIANFDGPGACGVQTTTVNSCLGGLIACNPNAICPTTLLSITFRSDNTSGFALMTDEDDDDIVGAPAPVAYTSGSNVTLSINWNDLCLGLQDINGACAGGKNGDLKIGIDSDNNGVIDDPATLKIRILDAATDLSTGVAGVLNFQLFPGDEKAYLKNHTLSSGTTADGNRVAGLRVFLTEGACPGPTALGNNVTSYEIEIDEDNNIDTLKLEGGLTNDVIYVGTVALADEAGNIGQFYDTNAAGQCTPDAQSVMPRAVFGMLEDNVNCFISTAAFGSPFHTKVEKFREFRDKVLSKTLLGQKFIQFYYKHSPPLANFIAEHESLRFLTRAALYPFWIFSVLAVQVGFLGATLLTLLSLVMAFFALKITAKVFTKKRFLVLALVSAASVSQAQEDFFNLNEEKVTAPQGEAPPLEPPYTGNEIEEMENVSTEKSTPAVDDLEVEVPSEDPYVQKNPNKWKAPSRVPEEERLKELADKEGLFKITASGEYLYDVKGSPQDSSASIRMALVSFPELANPTSGITFGEIYGDDDKPMLIADYEWQFLRTAIGKMGVKVTTGAMIANGNGQFLVPYTDPNTTETTTEAEEDFLFIMFPNTLSGIYRLQFSDTQWIVPFAEAGISYFTFIESEEGGDEIKFGGAPHFSFALGGSFLLDILGRDLILSVDRDYGINHMWLTAEYRRFEALNADFDFTGDVFSAGVMVEF